MPKKRKPEIITKKNRIAKPVQVILDELLVRESAEVQCTDAEIAELCGVTVEELLETFGPLMVRHRAIGRRKLRVTLYNKAISEIGINNAVAVWLSKQYLGMKDPEKTSDEEVDAIIEIVDYSKAKVEEPK